MKKILLTFTLFFIYNTIWSQDVHFSFDNATITNDGSSDFYEVDVMIQTINSTGSFKLGSGQLYFNYNTAAFGMNIFSNNKIVVTQPNAENYICGQYVDAAAADIYGTFTINDNTSSRVSWAFSQIFSSSTFANDNVTDVPKKLCHIKVEFMDSNQPPLFNYEEMTGFDDQFFTACGPDSGGPFESANCGTDAGLQLINDSFNSDIPVLSILDIDLVRTFVVYPNPTSEYINIKGRIEADTALEIFSVTGQKIQTIKENFNQIDVSRLENGVYFLKITSSVGEKNIKFIKE